VQHQLTTRVAVEVGYFRRWFGNFLVTSLNPSGKNLAVASGDFSPFSVTAPIDSRLPNGGGNVINGFYNLNPNQVGNTNNYITFSSDYGTQTEHWNGVDFSASARLQHGILFQGGFSVGKTITDNCGVVNAAIDLSPLGAPYCHVETNLMGQTQVKLLGTYVIPKADVNLAATFQSIPGPQISANYTALNAEVQPSLGRPLSGGAANVTVNLIPPGTFYGERANQLDFRVSRPFRMGRVRTAVNLDIYNTLNASPVIQENSAYASWRIPQRIMDGRLFKLSGQIDF
jgi:hypothetical protein